MNYDESQVLTNFIITALEDGHLPVIESDYCISLCGIKLWCENYPYAYGTIYARKTFGMPSRKAIKMLRDAERLVRTNKELQLKEYLDKNKQCE